MIIAFDLDGTLANIEHRLHFIHTKPKDWLSFFRACVDDTPILPIVKICQSLILAGNSVDIYSGRSSVVRGQTESWLNKHAIGYRQLLMRNDGDYRADDIVKAEWLANMPKENWPELVFDDRQRVVDMWRAHGIQCCQIAPGDF